LATGIETLSPVVFGAMWRRLQGEREMRERMVREALDVGITSIDTAPLYDFGGSEQTVGDALRGIRERAQILTKVGLRWDGDHGQTLFSATIDGARRDVRRDSRPQAVRRDVEDSLRRLQTDRLDLVQVHHRDRDTPIAETMGELLRLRGEGKLLAIGVSNFKPPEILEAARELGSVPLASVQEPYSLLERQIERELLPEARRLGAGVLCYSPLAQGVLAGALLGVAPSQWPARGAFFAPGNAAKIHAAMEHSLEPIAKTHDASLSQVALAWLLGEAGVRAVICGASSRRQLEENARAATLVLTAEERELLRATFSALQLAPEAGRGPLARAKSLLRRGARKLLGRR